MAFHSITQWATAGQGANALRFVPVVKILDNTSSNQPKLEEVTQFMEGAAREIHVRLAAHGWSVATALAPTAGTLAEGTFRDIEAWWTGAAYLVATRPADSEARAQAEWMQAQGERLIEWVIRVGSGWTSLGLTVGPPSEGHMVRSYAIESATERTGYTAPRMDAPRHALGSPEESF